MSILNSGFAAHPASAMGSGIVPGIALGAVPSTSLASKAPKRYIMGRHCASGIEQVDVFGTATITAAGNAKIYAWEHASVRAQDCSVVIAAGRAQVIAMGQADVVACDDVIVHAGDKAVVEALGNATVYAVGASHVRALENATVYASGNATVQAASLTGCTIHLSDEAKLIGRAGNSRVFQK